MIGLVLESSELLDEFETLLVIYYLDANLIGKMVTLWRNEFASKRGKSFDEIKSVLSERVYEQILKAVASGVISAGDVKPVLMKVLDGKKIEDALKIEKIDDDEIESEVRALIKSKPGMRANAYMGLVMAKFKGKLDAKKAMEIISKIIK